MFINEPTKIKKVSDCKYNFRQLHAAMLIDGDNFQLAFHNANLMIQINRGQFTYIDLVNSNKLTKEEAECRYNKFYNE
jgi:hypothetical protein